VELSSSNVRLRVTKDDAQVVSLVLHFDLRVSVVGMDVNCRGVRVALRCERLSLKLQELLYTALEEAYATLRMFQIPAGTSRLRELRASIVSAVSVDVEELVVTQTPASIPASLYIFVKDLGMDLADVLMQGWSSHPFNMVELRSHNASAQIRVDTQARQERQERVRALSTTKRVLTSSLPRTLVMGGIPERPVALESTPVLILCIHRADVTLPHLGRSITAELRGLRCVSQCRSAERCEPSASHATRASQHAHANEGGVVRRSRELGEQGSADRACAVSSSSAASGPATARLQSFSLFSSGNLSAEEGKHLSRPGSAGMGFRNRKKCYGRRYGGGLQAQLQLL
jgi:hypothetical protein